MLTAPTRYRRAIFLLTLGCLLVMCSVPTLFPAKADGRKKPSSAPASGQAGADAGRHGKLTSTKPPAEQRPRAADNFPAMNASLTQALCGFVNPPIDPSQMDCFTKLVADDSFNDPTDVGNRIPVILIHGIHGNRVDGDDDPQAVTNDGYFSSLISYLKTTNPTFVQRFKIYRFHYRSDYRSVWEIARSLRNRIDDLVQQNPQLESKKFVLVAHSMGGLVARSYMNEHDTDFGPTFKGRRGGERIVRLITLATPHHGSYVANDKSRISGHPVWGFAFDAFDFVYWQYQNGCADCNDDPTHANRGDLRFDNYNGLWNGNSDYTGDTREQNGWLRNLPKTYDRLISAYFGYIGGNDAVTAVGSLCTTSLGDYLNRSKDDKFALQIATGVLLSRIEQNKWDCDTPVTFLYNDGLVPTDSGMYKDGGVGKRVQCPGYNHDDMIGHVGGDCTVVGSSVKKPLLNLVLDELLSLPSGTSDTQSPSITITSPTSNSTFAAGSSSINLAGAASDNVGVTRVTWTNSRGGGGTASGTANWSASGIALQGGTNVLTVSAQDAAGNIGTDTLTVTFTATVSDTSPPSVKITSPTSGPTFGTTGSTLTLRGTATDNVGVTQVSWTNSRGGGGIASGTTNWTASVTGLQSGDNVLTVKARDAAGNAGTATLTVTFTPPPVCGGGTSENYRINGGPPLHPNGTLVKARNNLTVYLIQNGQKRGIPSEAILNGLYQQPNGGFQDKDVVTVADDELSRYPTGAVINSPLPSNGRSQPDGRLIQRVGGTEISIVTAGGMRRPFASESTFLGLGYLYCNVVPASDYDSYPAGVPVDATTTLSVSVNPTAQQTRDWGGSVTYTFTVTDGNGTPVSGAAVGGQDNLRGIGVFLATPSTDGNGQGTYTTTVPTGAANGVFDVMFVADETGYTGSDVVTRQVQVSHFQDTEPPSVSITSPTTNSFFSTSVSQVTLGGFASDNVGVTQVTWASDRVGGGTAGGTTNWTATVPLLEGVNVLTITARDASGNIGTANLTAVFTPSPTDVTPPSVSITSPTTSQRFDTTASAITLGGTASDNVGVTQVTWANDRGGGTASGTTSWTASSISLQEGFNVLTVIALDASGNIGTATLIVNLTTPSSDTAGPSLVVNSPADGQTVTSSSITISGTATDAGSGGNGISSVTVNGVRADGDTAGGSGIANWSRTITLNQGSNAVTVTARDSSPGQNQTTRTLTVNFQAAAPVLIGMTPNRVAAGGPGFVLTVNGSNFTQSSVVRWNGNDRVTRFISSQQLQADILADDIPVTGRLVLVSVFNPPGLPSANTLKLDWISDQSFQVTEIDFPPDVLPNRFPADFPRELPGDTVTQNYNAFTNGDQYQATRVFTTAKSIDENFAFYRDYLIGHGWSIGTTSEEPNFKALFATKDGFPAQTGVAASINSQINSITGVKSVSITFSSFTGCVTPPAGMLGRWSAEGDAADSVGGNTGFLRNGATTDANGPAGFGRAFNLDGVDDSVEIPDAPSLKPAAITVEAWVQLKSLESYSTVPGLQYIAFKKNSRSQQFEGFSLQKVRSGGKDVFEFVVSSAGGAQARATGTHSVIANQFYHVVGTYDGGTVKLYVNGVLEAQAAHSSPLDYGTRPFFIGSSGETDTLDGKLSGIIDEVTLYSRALSADEVHAIYDAGGVGKCKAASGLPTLQFSTSGLSVSEGAGAAQVTVTRAGDLSGTSAVAYETSNLSASDRSDYTAAAGTLRFGPGEVSKAISVYVTDDAFAEPAETFTLTLKNPVGATLGGPSSVTVTINDNDVANGPSPVRWDTNFSAPFYVRQQYLDFLSREPDASGFAFWQNEINSCGADAQCREVKRINVSAAFFLSIEFQETGYLVYRAYKAAYGNIAADKPVPVRFKEFLADTQEIGRGVQVGIGDWQTQLENNKRAYFDTMVAGQRFVSLYPASMTAAQFVDKLNQNAGGVISQSARDGLVSDLSSGAKTRAQVLRAVAEDPGMQRQEFNRAFVLMQYFGYLRRDPDSGNDVDFSGWQFWLSKLDQFGGNFQNAEMVKAFLLSTEYQQRFGQ
jgi:pimeloyl-ACP methyl ester carboxylesterase